MNLDLTQLLQLIKEVPAYRQLLAEVEGHKGDTSAAVLDAAKPYFLAALYHHLKLPMLVVTAAPENSQKLQEQLSIWLASGEIKRFPEPDSLPYQRVAADTSTELARIQALSALLNRDAPVMITSAAALMQKVAPHSEFSSAFHTIKQGMEIEPLKLLSQWEAIGYRRESLVEVPGTMSQRGGIIDIYPPTSELPARLEFFGNTIDSLRRFDPASQRSREAVAEIAIGPATELLSQTLTETTLTSLDLSGCRDEVREQFQEEIARLRHKQRPENIGFYAPLFNRDSLLDYLPDNAMLIIDEPENIKPAIAELDSEADELRVEKIKDGELPRHFPRPYFNWAELEAKLTGRRCLSLSAWGLGGEKIYQLGFTPTPGYAGQLPVFLQKAKEMLNQKDRLILSSHQASRLSELLYEEDIIAPALTKIKELPPPGSLTLLQGSLAEGWVMDNTYLLTDAELFGFTKERRLVKKHPVPHHQLLAEINPGEYVVHVEYGIARLAGVTTMKTENIEREYLALEYAAGDRLYVPTDQIDRVSRYVGAGDRPPVLSRLGTAEWHKAKQRTKESVINIAQEMLALYATREVAPGFAFASDTAWQEELEASFPYVETPDQLEAMAQVKKDMSQTKPMDRLVCGDVGYGKTEVAVRAAFKAVTGGKQVAVLVPTTVLAEQHYATFKQRLDAFPLRTEVLSRFKSEREQSPIIKDLANGKVDICIGTHRLLQKDIVFKDLGLLIIDEEQRFGVNHKEHFKRLRQAVDVLTLSATPIPRTLHMSLVGVRDMSTMETPPEERLPIRTYVAEFNERLIREAVLRELERNGQVFFVHNRVQSIALMANRLEQLVPEARIAIAHGQMPETELERVMADFTQGRSDVLVCTTIIQSGLDMPNVNTLIVNQADKFGLTELYQLRGRVGRGANLAYAYFLYEREKRLTPTARKRLKTIFAATELGSGFGIAMKDLEIRGAGNLLGVRQSGFINAVGFSLYCQLLTEAVDELKAKRAGVPRVKERRPPPPSVDLPLPAFIPDEYVSDLNTRLSLYRRLSKLEDINQIDEVAQEFADRFGAPPPEVENLLYAVRIKLLASGAGIESITREDRQLVLRRYQGMRFDKEHLEPYLEKLGSPLKDAVTLSPTQLRLHPKRLGGEWKRVLEEVLTRVG